MAELFAEQDFASNSAPLTLSKKQFAAHIGLSPGRITQLIDRGLPVTNNGRIDVAAGVQWYRNNVDPNRQKVGVDTDPANLRIDSARSMREQAEAEIATLKVRKMAGELLDRKATLGAIEARGRMERDAWLGWVNRTAPEVARLTGAPMPEVTALLDRLVREQLATLAAMPGVVE